MAVRAPALAGLFLVVTFATLAMPGSPNFVGELLILFGTFQTEFVYGLVASVGVVLASVYMIRVYQRTMHNRTARGVAGRAARPPTRPAGGGPPPEAGRPDLATVAPLVAVIIALGVIPQFLLDRSEEATTAKVKAARAIADRGSSAQAQVRGHGGDPAP
jgi:NADH-quinone oxidoreductase subunit M